MLEGFDAGSYLLGLLTLPGAFVLNLLVTSAVSKREDEGE